MDILKQWNECIVGALENSAASENTLKSSWGSSVDELYSNDSSALHYSCRDCHSLTFENADELEKHLIECHIKDPSVLLQRLTDGALRRIEQRRGRNRKGAFARKRSQSYLVPRVKGVKKSLKLKLKVSGESSCRSFEVIPENKIWAGPGGLYTANRGDISDVKTEDFLSDVEWEKSLEGSSEQPVLGVEERTLNDEPNSSEKENSNENDEQVSRNDLVNNEALENHNSTENGIVLSIEKEELDIPPSPEPTPCPTPNVSSPTSPLLETNASPLGDDPASEELSPPQEQLESEFLPPESETDFPSSPNMVEINNATVTDVRSPVFPTTSPAPPTGQPTPPSEPQTIQHSDGTPEGENEESQELPPTEQLQCSDSSNGVDSNSFVWTGVNSSEGDVGEDTTTNQTLEERDPLLLNDSAPPSTEHGGDMQGSPGSTAMDSSDQSLLRGFLSDEANRTGSGPNVSGLESFNLGSEYISLERLGDNAYICDVCGERSADEAALQDHKFQSGHFKCSQPECGGAVFSNADEFVVHQQNVHGSRQYSQQTVLNQSQSLMNQQSAPVQQLAQQVQRLPVPQMSLQALMKGQPPHSAAIPQQMSSNMVTLITSQPNQFQSVCRPPIYAAPGPNLMQQQHSAPPPPPPYPGQQVMYPQPYPPHSQSFTSANRVPMQMQPRPYSTMMQQINQNTMRHPGPRMQYQNVQPRAMTTQNVNSSSAISGVKRVQNSPSSPVNKQRRLDLLIPDRHDDADCHVIAMQKRTESGPIITGVQGSSPVSSRQTPPSDSTINLTDSITLSVRGQNANNANGGKTRNDANSVANLLATRGITVTPAGATGRGNPNQMQAPPPQHRQPTNRPPPPAPPPQPPPQPVTTLNLNSAISIIPTASSRTPPKQQVQQTQQPGVNFAVPQGRTANRPQQQQTQVERPPRPPTVDLTGDTPTPSMIGSISGRGRGRGRAMLGRNMCQLCDKQFATLEALNQHMVTHRPGKLPFRCNMCTAQYPTQQGLLQHRQTYHKESPAQMGSELVLPVVDLKQPATLNRLSSLGIRHYIPLSQLSSQSGALLGLPIVSVDGGRIPSANLSAVGAAAILTLGPLRQIPR